VEFVRANGSKYNLTITAYGKKYFETVLTTLIPLSGYDDEKAKNLEIFIEKKNPV